MLDGSVPPEARPEDAHVTIVPWTGWDLVGALCVGLALGVGVVIATVLVANMLEPVPSLGYWAGVSAASVAIYGGLAIAGWGFALRRRGATLQDAGFRWTGIGPVLLALPLVVVLMIATFLVLTVSSAIFGDIPTAQEQVAPGETTLRPIDLVWFLFAGAVAAPIVEEFLFRGLLFPYLRARRGVVFGVVVSSALFAVLHFVPPLIPALFVFGIVQAVVAYRLKSLYPAIALHALNNAIVILGVYVSLSGT